MIQKLMILGLIAATAALASQPPPAAPTSSPVMLAGPWVPADSHKIDFGRLPRLVSEHAVVSDVLGAGGHRVNQHNYLVHFAGKFWAMWSDGPGGPRGQGNSPHHDLADQHVSFAMSPDGLKWGAIANLSGRPDPGYGWIARGFWVREGKLLALASRFEFPSYAGPGLSLHAWQLESAEPARWRHLGLVFDDAMNNFPPKQLPTGEWMMSRRDGKRDVHYLIGGVEAFNRWQSFPAATYRDEKMQPEEPYWWVLPDGRTIAALYRDNGRSGYLTRGFSTDHGRTWTTPVRTNFPDATAKFSGVRLPDGRYILVSNPHPKRRDPLTLAVSRDGLVFSAMGYLVGGRHVDYPHIIHHEGHLYVAFATAKQTVEVLKLPVAEVDRLERLQGAEAGR